jgi:hypothetical protein
LVRSPFGASLLALVALAAAASACGQSQQAKDCTELKRVYNRTLSDLRQDKAGAQTNADTTISMRLEQTEAADIENRSSGAFAEDAGALSTVIGQYRLALLGGHSSDTNAAARRMEAVGQRIVADCK